VSQQTRVRSCLGVPANTCPVPYHFCPSMLPWHTCFKWRIPGDGLSLDHGVRVRRRKTSESSSPEALDFEPERDDCKRPKITAPMTKKTATAAAATTSVDTASSPACERNTPSPAPVPPAAAARQTPRNVQNRQGAWRRFCPLPFHCPAFGQEKASSRRGPERLLGVSVGSTKLEGALLRR